ncbi:MAG: ANTAR domain-containing response regulator [Chloroflexota bacterium]
MRKVLVIDDHEPSRCHLVSILAEGGYEIAGQGVNGKTALALARTADPDVILMAVGLPGIDGLDTARDMMQARPVPIILTTSHYDAATIERAKLARVMAYLVKPLRAEELNPTIELVITRFREFVALRTENSTLKETLEARKQIERAKGLLMQQRGMSEEQAYTLIKKTSMNLRKPMAEVAQAVIVAGGIFRGDKS